MPGWHVSALKVAHCLYKYVGHSLCRKTRLAVLTLPHASLAADKTSVVSVARTATRTVASAATADVAIP